MPAYNLLMGVFRRWATWRRQSAASSIIAPVDRPAVPKLRAAWTWPCSGVAAQAAGQQRLHAVSVLTGSLPAGRGSGAALAILINFRAALAGGADFNRRLHICRQRLDYEHKRSFLPAQGKATSDWQATHEPFSAYNIQQQPVLLKHRWTLHSGSGPYMYKTAAQ